MRVLWLSPVQLPAVAAVLGGPSGRTGGWIPSLASALGDRKVELAIACITGTPFTPFVSDGISYYPLMHALNSGRWGRAALLATNRMRSLDYRPQCADAVRLCKPDLIHVHGTETSLGLIAGLTPVPTLVSLQGLVRELVPRYFDGVSVADLARDTAHIYRLGRGAGLLSGYFALKKCVSAELSILTSAHFFTGRTAFDRGVLQRANPGAVYYHCDRALRSEFYVDYVEPCPQRPILYCTGGPAPYKGLDVLLEAAAELVSMGFTDLEVRIGGRIQGSPMWGPLRRRMERLGLRSRVEWLGPLTASGIVQELQTCAVSVVPSWLDNSPNSLAESMLRGVACVASTAGGIPSMIEHDVNGLLFERGDSHGLALALQRVIEDEDLRQRLGRAAHEHAVVRHNPDRIADLTVSCYGSIMES